MEGSQKWVTWPFPTPLTKFCIFSLAPRWLFCVQNFKFLPSAIPEIWWGAKFGKIRSCDPFLTRFDLILQFFITAPRGQAVCQIWSFWLQPFPRYRGGPKIWKVGHVTPSRTVNKGSPVTTCLNFRPQFAYYYATFMVGLWWRLGVVYRWASPLLRLFKLIFGPKFGWVTWPVNRGSPVTCWHVFC